MISSSRAADTSPPATGRAILTDRAARGATSCRGEGPTLTPPRPGGVSACGPTRTQGACNHERHSSQRPATKHISSRKCPQAPTSYKAHKFPEMLPGPRPRPRSGVEITTQHTHTPQGTLTAQPHAKIRQNPQQRYGVFPSGYQNLDCGSCQWPAGSSARSKLSTRKGPPRSFSNGQLKAG